MKFTNQRAGLYRTMFNEMHPLDRKIDSSSPRAAMAERETVWTLPKGARILEDTNGATHA